MMEPNRLAVRNQTIQKLLPRGGCKLLGRRKSRGVPRRKKVVFGWLASLRVQPSIEIGLANEQTAPRWQGSACSVAAFGM